MGLQLVIFFLSPFIYDQGCIQHLNPSSVFSVPFRFLRSNTWDQTFCVTELSLQLESRGKRLEPKPCKAFKLDKIKFDANSHLILDFFPPVFQSKIICIATSNSSRVMFNTTFPVIDEVIQGFKPNLNLYIRIVLN